MTFRELAIVWAHITELLNGMLVTVAFAVAAGALAMLGGAVLTMLLMGHSKLARNGVRTFIGLMRCTPFLLLAYLMYYGLPSLGLRLTNVQSGALALTLYHSAYITEILRAGWLARPKEEIEAGRAFGFSWIKLVYRLILPNVWVSQASALGNQIIQVVKDTSFLTIIAVPELTFTANDLQSNYYIPFAALFSAVMIYWVLCLVIELVVSVLRRRAERFQ
jgi:polar amino acid transport system permease protein